MVEDPGVSETNFLDNIHLFHYLIVLLLLALLYFSYDFGIKLQKQVVYFLATILFILSVFVFYKSQSFVMEMGVAVINLLMICIVHNFISKFSLSLLCLTDVIAFLFVVGYILFFELLSISIISVRFGLIRSESIDGYLLLIVGKLLSISVVGSMIGIFIPIMRIYRCEN